MLPVVLEQLSEDSRAISNWSTQNLLTLNSDKTTVMYLGRFSELEEIHDLLLEFQYLEEPLPFFKTAKNLGVIIDSTLTWNEHIKKIKNSVNFILYRL